MFFNIHREQWHRNVSRTERGYLKYQDTFVWRKLHSYGVIIKMGVGLQPPSSPGCYDRLILWK